MPEDSNGYTHYVVLNDTIRVSYLFQEFSTRKCWATRSFLLSQGPLV